MIRLFRLKHLLFLFLLLCTTAGPLAHSKALLTTNTSQNSSCLEALTKILTRINLDTDMDSSVAKAYLMLEDLDAGFTKTKIDHILSRLGLTIKDFYIYTVAVPNRVATLGNYTKEQSIEILEAYAELKGLDKEKVLRKADRLLGTENTRLMTNIMVTAEFIVTAILHYAYDFKPLITQFGNSTGIMKAFSEKGHFMTSNLIGFTVLEYVLVALTSPRASTKLLKMHISGKEVAAGRSLRFQKFVEQLKYNAKVLPPLAAMTASGGMLAAQLAKHGIENFMNGTVTPLGYEAFTEAVWNGVITAFFMGTSTNFRYSTIFLIREQMAAVKPLVRNTAFYTLTGANLVFASWHFLIYQQCMDGYLKPYFMDGADFFLNNETQEREKKSFMEACTSQNEEELQRILEEGAGSILQSTGETYTEKQSEAMSYLSSKEKPDVELPEELKYTPFPENLLQELDQ